MRLQIAPLPQEPTGPNDGDWRIPYLLVLDEVPEAFAEQLDPGLLADGIDPAGSLRDESGARGVLVFSERIEVVPPWAFLDLEAADLANVDELKVAAKAAGDMVRAQRRAAQPPASI